MDRRYSLVPDDENHINHTAIVERGDQCVAFTAPDEIAALRVLIGFIDADIAEESARRAATAAGMLKIQPKEGSCSKSP